MLKSLMHPLRPWFAKMAKTFLQLAIDKSLKHALPAIYRRLDAEMPYWLQHSVHAQTIEMVIQETASSALKRDPQPFEIALVKLLYDPAVAVAKTAAANIKNKNRL